MFSNIDETHASDDEKLLTVLSVIAGVVTIAFVVAPRQMNVPASDLVLVVDGRCAF